MVINLIKYVAFFLNMIIFISCNHEGIYDRGKAKKMIDEAYSELRLKDDSLTYSSALNKIEKAIGYDSSYAGAFISKANLLCRLNLCDSSARFLDYYYYKFINDTWYNITSGIVMLKIDKNSVAREYFIKAIRIIGDPKNSNESITFIQLKYFLYGKEVAFKELDRLKAKMTDMDYNLTKDMVENTSQYEMFDF